MFDTDNILNILVSEAGINTITSKRLIFEYRNEIAEKYAKETQINSDSIVDYDIAQLILDKLKEEYITDIKNMLDYLFDLEDNSTMYLLHDVEQKQKFINYIENRKV